MLEIKRHADPLGDFCASLMPISTATGLFMGNANIRLLNLKCYLYHVYLKLMASRGHPYPLSLTTFGQAVQQTLKEYERILLKSRKNNGIQTNPTLYEDSEADWLTACSQ